MNFNTELTETGDYHLFFEVQCCELHWTKDLGIKCDRSGGSLGLVFCFLTKFLNHMPSFAYFLPQKICSEDL